jgi:hypothetical protein
MIRIQCKLVKSKLTPSGYSDNGIKYLSDKIVSFHPDKLLTATIEEIECKGLATIPTACITIDGISWNVELTPKIKKIMNS